MSPIEPDWKRALGQDPAQHGLYFAVPESDQPYFVGGTERILHLTATTDAAGLARVGKWATVPLDFAHPYLTTDDYLDGPAEALFDRADFVQLEMRILLSRSSLRDTLAGLLALSFSRGDRAQEELIAAALKDVLTPVEAARLANMIEPGRPDSRALISRQLLLVAMRRALLVADVQRSDKPTYPVHALYLSHLIGESLGTEVRDESERIAGLPETLAISMLQNQHFNDHYDIFAGIERVLRLWGAQSGKLIGYCGGSGPRQLLTEATGLEVDDFLAIGLGLLAHTANWKPGQPLLIDETLGCRLDDQVLQRLLAIIAADPDQIAERLRHSTEGEWDFLALQEKPVVRFGRDLLVLDEQFLMQRLTTGLFWMVHDYLKLTKGETARLQWTQAWGEMIELSVECQLRALAPATIGAGQSYFTEENLQQAYPAKGVKYVDAVLDFGDRWVAFDRVPRGGGLSGVMPGVAQSPVVMPVAGLVSVSRVVSSSASDVSVR